MKTTAKVTITLLALSASAWMLMAQDTGNRPSRHERPPRGAGQGSPGMNGHRPPPPVIAVLDANHDGVIDAAEIANASAALLTLDKNGDGQLTPEELRPPQPDGDAGGPPSGDEGEGRPPRGPSGDN